MGAGLLLRILIIAGEVAWPRVESHRGTITTTPLVSFGGGGRTGLSWPPSLWCLVRGEEKPRERGTGQRTGRRHGPVPPYWSFALTMSTMSYTYL